MSLTARVSKRRRVHDNDTLTRSLHAALCWGTRCFESLDSTTQWTRVPRRLWLVPYTGNRSPQTAKRDDVPWHRRIVDRGIRDSLIAWTGPYDEVQQWWQDRDDRRPLAEMMRVIGRTWIRRIDAFTLYWPLLQPSSSHVDLRKRVCFFGGTRWISDEERTIAFYRRDLQNRQVFLMFLPFLEEKGDGDHAVARRIFKFLAFFDA